MALARTQRTVHINEVINRVFGYLLEMTEKVVMVYFKVVSRPLPKMAEIIN
jgi:hypothetical protein